MNQEHLQPGGPADTAGYPEAEPPTHVDMPPGGSFLLRVHPVTKQIGDDAVGMLSYNGSIPGPTLRMRQGSQVDVTVSNETDMETTVHWHGLRLENRYDGVPHETQKPIPPGGSYTHRLNFPDPGLYWYHPHVREDYAQELGLYGNIIVEPEDPTYWPQVDRDVVLTLDDILIEDGAIAHFGSDGPNFATMGRYGNVMLVGGETDQSLVVQQGERVRFYLTNTANTRVFKVAVPRVSMKLVGGDSGRYEQEQWVSEVVIAPSERVVFDALFDETGPFNLEHHTPDRVYQLAPVDVHEGAAARARPADFDTLRVDPDLVVERTHISRWMDTSPDKTLGLVADMKMPDTSEIASDTHASHDHGPAHHGSPEGSSDGIEWEDAMVDMNRLTTSADIRWSIVDFDTGQQSPDINWSFQVGDRVKIRLVNEMASDHPMHHPFHIHGQRFLVLTRDGVQEPNLVWKDTVLVRTGQVVDILMDAPNPGLWMFHCHIPEHMGSGMGFSFRVER